MNVSIQLLSVLGVTVCVSVVGGTERKEVLASPVALLQYMPKAASSLEVLNHLIHTCYVLNTVWTESKRRETGERELSGN
jgi:hypothetical protein